VPRALLETIHQLTRLSMFLSERCALKASHRVLSYSPYCTVPDKAPMTSWLVRRCKCASYSTAYEISNVAGKTGAVYPPAAILRAINRPLLRWRHIYPKRICGVDLGSKCAICAGKGRSKMLCISSGHEREFLPAVPRRRNGSLLERQVVAQPLQLLDRSDMLSFVSLRSRSRKADRDMCPSRFGKV